MVMVGSTGSVSWKRRRRWNWVMAGMTVLFAVLLAAEAVETERRPKKGKAVDNAMLHD
jgi:hypothetical protein